MKLAGDMSMRVTQVKEIIEALSTPPEARTASQIKTLKVYVHNEIPLAE